MGSFVEFFEENKDLLNFLLGLVTAIASALAFLVRWLYKRLNEEIRFSPATALGIGYFQNFVNKIGPELAKKPRIVIDGLEQNVPREKRKVYIYLPENLPGASHQGVAEYKHALEERGLKVVDAKVITDSRPFPFYAILDKSRPDSDPVLFDYPTALGNMVEVLNYHEGENAFKSKRNKRLKLEAREIRNFSDVLTKLIHDKNLGSFFEVSMVDPASHLDR